MSVCKICNVSVQDTFEYCYTHYKESTAAKMVIPAGQWHADPVVDQLMKINANLGKIAIALSAPAPKPTGFLDDVK